MPKGDLYELLTGDQDVSVHRGRLECRILAGLIGGRSELTLKVTDLIDCPALLHLGDHTCSTSSRGHYIRNAVDRASAVRIWRWGMRKCNKKTDFGFLRRDRVEPRRLCWLLCCRESAIDVLAWAIYWTRGWVLVTRVERSAGCGREIGCVGHLWQSLVCLTYLQPAAGTR